MGWVRFTFIVESIDDLTGRRTAVLCFELSDSASCLPSEDVERDALERIFESLLLYSLGGFEFDPSSGSLALLR